jgi:excisionase family DNA binding protein
MSPADRVNAAVAELAAALRDQLRAEIEAAHDEPPTLLDVASAAHLLGVSRTTLYGSILDRPGGVPSLHVGKRRLVRREDVESFASR